MLDPTYLSLMLNSLFNAAMEAVKLPHIKSVLYTRAPYFCMYIHTTTGCIVHAGGFRSPEAIPLISHFSMHLHMLCKSRKIH